MKSKLVLCSMVLGCSMGLMAQQSSAPGSAPGTTPPTFPQDQSSSQVGTQSGQTSSPTATPDAQDQTSQTGKSDSSMSGQKQKVEGCLSGTDGNFTLTDKSGVTYQLQGENSELSKHVGQEVRIEGMAAAAATTNSTSSSASSSSDTSSASPSSASGSSANSLMVHKVKKVSDSCSTGSASGSPSK